MPYYGAGGYAYAAGGMGNYAAGGFSLKGLVKGVGKVVGTVAKAGVALVTGGPIAAAGQVIQAIAPTPTANTPIPQLPIYPLQGVPTRQQQQQGVVQTGVSPLGTVGVRFGKSRRMNAGNAKAARRAIRRIKAVRHLLVGIERELPRRAAPRSSRGVITRAEAARALRN